MISLSRPLILASNSPRRKQLLHEAGFDFAVEILPTDESYPTELESEKIAGYISHQKAEMFIGINRGEMILTADTVVILNNEVLGKPKDEEEATRMLSLLSGTTHQVITAVSLLIDGVITTVSDMAIVSFCNLEEREIKYYIDQYKPFDKAGSYGIQEWIGMIGINKIEGSYYTIMGLPVHVVYQLLKPYMVTSS